MRNCNFYKDQESYAGIVKAMYQQHADNGYSIDTDAFTYKKALTVFLQFQAKGKYQYVTNKPIYFPHEQQINNNTIKGIELLGTTVKTHANTSPQTDLPQTQYGKGYLALVDNCEMVFMKIPLSLLCRALNGNKIAMYDLSNVNWSACYVLFTANAALSAANSLQFNIYI